jgi:hypothetical protein
MRSRDYEEESTDDLRWLVDQQIEQALDLAILGRVMPSLVADSGVDLHDWDEDTRGELQDHVAHASRGQLTDYLRERNDYVRRKKHARDRRRR